MSIKMNRPYLMDKIFLQSLDTTLAKEISVKIVLLDREDTEVGEIHGISLSGSITINGSSSLRRVCGLSLLANREYNDILQYEDVLSLNKRIKIEVGYKNTLSQYKHYPEIIWFPMGVYIITEINTNKTPDGMIINLAAQDKMCLLNGTVGGIISSPIVLHEKATRVSKDVLQYEPVTMFEIIKELVSQIGEELSSKVIINDLPKRVKKAFVYMGKTTQYYDPHGNLTTAEKTDVTGPNIRKVESGDVAGYDWIPFTYPAGELIAQTGDSIVSILDTLVDSLGNYEFFYDLDGNFIFQEIKNYLNTSFIPITQRTGEDYAVNLAETPAVYNFTGDPTIISYSNQPSLNNIKNDFVVWGQRETFNGAKIPIRFHLAIDKIPQSKNPNIPWQVQMYLDGKAAKESGKGANYYYRELEHEMPKLYWLPEDPENKDGKSGWKNVDGSSMDYYLEMISEESELGKFSVSTIGRRTVAVTDKNVRSLYHPDIPDYVILQRADFDKKKEDLEEIINGLNAIKQPFIIVEDIDVYTYANIGKAAFDVVRDLVHQHTTYSEDISVTMMPKYYLEPNTIVSFADSETGIDGNYIITQIQIPLDTSGNSTITAVKTTTRI